MQTIMKIPGFGDSVLTHLLAGLAAGFFAVCIGSPVDVVSILFFFLLHKKQQQEYKDHLASFLYQFL